jgi:hypothetical protein
MAVEVPHFNLPFQLGASGAAVVEQDSIDDIAVCVVAILSTHIGWRAEVPTFGMPDLALRRQPIGAEDIHTLVSGQEQRALLVVDEHPDQVDSLIDHINVGVSLVSKGGQ